MSWLRIPKSVTRAAEFAFPRAEPRTRMPARQMPGTSGISTFEASPSARKDTDWWKGRPLSEARNAHSTNTREHFEAAIAEGANFLEGDIRQEINPPHALEMRHDSGHEPGDNLLLREWLEEGKASGRGLKLDVKEGQHLEEILDAVEESGVPSERLMFNLGDGDMAQWSHEIRERFPDAILAINPASKLDGKENSGPLENWQVERMIDLAEEGGAPVTFVVRHDLLTDEAIQSLSAHGTVSVWNSPSQGGVDDVEALASELRERGVNGVIDLRPSMSNLDKVTTGIEKGLGWAKGKLDGIL